VDSSNETQSFEGLTLVPNVVGEGYSKVLPVEKLCGRQARKKTLDFDRFLSRQCSLKKDEV
jgi:hypothetical protein